MAEPLDAGSLAAAEGAFGAFGPDAAAQTPPGPFLDVVTLTSSSHNEGRAAHSPGPDDALLAQPVAMPTLTEVGVSRDRSDDSLWNLPSGKQRPLFRERIRRTYLSAVDAVPRWSPDRSRPSNPAPRWVDIGSRFDVEFHDREHLPRTAGASASAGAFTRIRQHTADGVECLPGTLGEGKRSLHVSPTDRERRHSRAAQAYLATSSGVRWRPATTAHGDSAPEAFPLRQSASRGAPASASATQSGGPQRGQGQASPALKTRSGRRSRAQTRAGTQRRRYTSLRGHGTPPSTGTLPSVQRHDPLLPLASPRRVRRALRGDETLWREEQSRVAPRAHLPRDGEARQLLRKLRHTRSKLFDASVR